MNTRANAVATQSPLQKFRELLWRNNKQISSVLPAHVDAKRMMGTLMAEVRKDPNLLECDPRTVIGAMVEASRLGLEIGGTLGHAYMMAIKPRDSTKPRTAQLVIGYRGMIDLARRSGAVVSIEARLVHEGDSFRYQLGLHPDIEHIPTDRRPGPVTHAYAVARLVGGGVQFEVISRATIDEMQEAAALKDRYRSGPWFTNPGEMAKKSVVRKLFKFLPISVDVQRGVALDEAGDAGDQELGHVLDGEFDRMPEDEGSLGDGGWGNGRNGDHEPEAGSIGEGEDVADAEVVASPDAEPAEAPPATPTGGPTLAEIEQQIRDAQDIDQLQEAIAVLSSVQRTCGDPARWGIVRSLATSRRNEMQTRQELGL